MVNLGVCVYPDMRPLSEIEEYFKLISKYGFNYAFSSMFSMEGTNEEIITCFRDFIELAHKYNLKVALDVNPEFLERMGCSADNIKLFDDIKCDIIRLDGDFSLQDNIKIINNPYSIGVQFNASMPSGSIQKLLENGIKPEQITTCHNFYPQPKTGMKWQAFKDATNNLRGFGLQVAACVASHNKPSHGVWNPIAGLPTVEMMRYYPIDLQAKLLIASGITDVLIGNAYASEEEIKALANAVKPLDENDPKIIEAFNKYAPYVSAKKISDLEVRRIKLKLDKNITDKEKEILFDFFPHFDRGDTSEWMFRSTLSRIVYSKGEGVPARDIGKKEFEVGDVMIVNNNYQHYAGEVQICTLPFEDDKIRNVVGHISEEEMKAVELLKVGQIWQFDAE